MWLIYCLGCKKDNVIKSNHALKHLSLITHLRPCNLSNNPVYVYAGERVLIMPTCDLRLRSSLSSMELQVNNLSSFLVRLGTSSFTARQKVSNSFHKYLMRAQLRTSSVPTWLKIWPQISSVELILFLKFIYLNLHFSRWVLRTFTRPIIKSIAQNYEKYMRFWNF